MYNVHENSTYSYLCSITQHIDRHFIPMYRKCTCTVCTLLSFVVISFASFVRSFSFFILLFLLLVLSVSLFTATIPCSFTISYFSGILQCFYAILTCSSLKVTNQNSTKFIRCGGSSFIRCDLWNGVFALTSSGYSTSLNWPHKKNLKLTFPFLHVI